MANIWSGLLREHFLLGGIPQIQGRRKHRAASSPGPAVGPVFTIIFIDQDQRTALPAAVLISGTEVEPVLEEAASMSLYKFNSKNKVHNFSLNKSTNTVIHKYSAALYRKTQKVFPQTSSLGSF